MDLGGQSERLGIIKGDSERYIDSVKQAVNRAQDKVPDSRAHDLLCA